MDYFSPINIGIFLVDIALAVHCVRTGRSVLWILALSVASFAFGFLALERSCWKRVRPYRTREAAPVCRVAA